MPKIFISYRRADSQYVTDIVYDKMAQHFGKEDVFLDVGSIPFGVDFRTYLNEQVASHDVVLVIIGSDWARIMQERADSQNDFVRIEIESALKQGKLVIPVLVKNASMPDFSDLPESIRELQWRNSARIRRQPDLENDCTLLAAGMKQFFQTNSQTPATVKQSIITSKSLMPAPFDWIEIPGKDYSIAKYPVTNAQFAKFIEAGGYKNDKWWTEAGLKHRNENTWAEPRYWQDSKWNGITQPVGVSWYESVAFCLWLSEAIGDKIMLPTEAQWQYAAQGNDGRTYPWGNKWNADLCNNNVDSKGIGKTTPVTQYEGKGDSPFGVVDMAGNVWEWCLTDYDKKTNKINSNAISRVLRGGPWNGYGTGNFLCDFRYGNDPHIRYYNNGFRVVRLS